MSDLTRDAWEITMKQIDTKIGEMRPLIHDVLTDDAREYRLASVAAWTFARDALVAKIAEMDGPDIHRLIGENGQ